MKCPDCESSLVPVDIVGISKSYRCLMCGGVFLYGKGKDGLPERTITQWTQMHVEPKLLQFGKNMCPTDGVPLVPVEDKSMREMQVRKCNVCHWWWFPTESLFLYDPAGMKPSNWETVFKASRTLILVSVMAVGIGYGVKMVMTKQQQQIQASTAVRSFSSTFVGNGKQLVTFESDEMLFTLPYRPENGQWKYVPVTRDGNKYIFTIEGLTDNVKYEILINQKSYFFTTKN